MRKIMDDITFFWLFLKESYIWLIMLNNVIWKGNLKKNKIDDPAGKKISIVLFASKDFLYWFYAVSKLFL